MPSPLRAFPARDHSRGIPLTILRHSLALLAFACPAAYAVDQGLPFHDLALGFSSTAPVHVREHSSDPGGAATDYDWNGEEHRGYRLAFTSTNGIAHDWGGWVWGGELAFARTDITPTDFGVGGQRFRNSSPHHLSCQELDLDLLGGYEYGIAEDDGVSAFLLVLPWVGLTGMLADDDLQTQVGAPSYTRGRGAAVTGEFGLTIGGYLTERGWIYGVVCSASRLAITTVGVDYSDGYHSDLTLSRAGVAVGFQVGGRF